MKVLPTKDDFKKATNFLNKVSLLQRIKQCYESNLQNMGDDFMLLRFGRIFGPDALPTTAQCNNQFKYLVHLFLKSMVDLLMMLQTTGNDQQNIGSFVKILNSNLFSAEIYSNIIKLNEDDFFSPKLNIDQWTWLLEKWRDTLRTFPMMLTEIGAYTRLLRTTIGIGIARLFSLTETIVVNGQALDSTFINEQLFHALQTGFYFGVAYAVVDSIQDEIRNIDESRLQHIKALIIEIRENNRLLTSVELLDQWTLKMEELLSGQEFDRKDLPNTPLTPLLLETFDSLITLTKGINATTSSFNELALLLRSQRLDKKAPENFYDDEDLYLGKSLYESIYFVFITKG